MVIDTHCHVQFPQYDTDRDEVIRRALDAGVGMICVGTDLEMSRKAVEVAERYEGVWASVGLHPNDNLTEHYNQRLYQELAQHEKVAAVGEIGLDYYRTTDAHLKEIQRDRFLQQLTLTNKPLIIHCRDAHDDMIAILKTANRQGVIHSFTGTKAHALAYADMGYYLGVNGIITFTDQYNEALAAVPQNRIVIETDAPYLTPTPHRGKRNEPVYILETAKKLQIPLEILRKNTEELFNI